MYWTAGPGPISVSKNGGTPQRLAGDLATGTGLAIDATHLYWARTGTLVDDTLLPGFVARMALPDGEATLVATAESFESPSEVALYGGYLYWVQRNGDVWRAAPDGKCAGKLTENTIGGNGIAVGSQGVFFNTLNNGALSRSSLSAFVDPRLDQIGQHGQRDRTVAQDHLVKFANVEAIT